ncbi:hypothetical protein Q1695_015804 [Nippostrongylus brasiliensis]|nr:hypothetical protein Q1695_015804 [Nippostrongylus brasiliensis]
MGMRHITLTDGMVKLFLKPVKRLILVERRFPLCYIVKSLYPFKFIYSVLILPIVPIVFCTTLLLFHCNRLYDIEGRTYADFYWQTKSGYSNVSSNRWIVLTSSHFTYDEIEDVSTDLGWNIVVIEETISEHIRSNGKIFTQRAEWILSTNNLELLKSSSVQFDFDSYVSGLRYHAPINSPIRQKLLDPNRILGHRPSEAICSDCMSSCRLVKTSTIQHVPLENADGAPYTSLNIVKHTPPITLAAGNYALLGSGINLLHRRAFFTIPLLQGNKTEDVIIGSLLTQKLLHLVDDTLALHPPIHHQTTGSSSERQEKHVLETWKCDGFSDLMTCMDELMRELRIRNFLDGQTYSSLKAWLTSLSNLKYDFPTLQRNIVWPRRLKYESCRRAFVYLPTVSDGGEEVNEGRFSVTESFRDLDSWCNAVHVRGSNWNGTGTKDVASQRTVFPTKFSQSVSSRMLQKQNTVLIIVSNVPWKSSIGLLQRLYSPYFGMTVFCGNFDGEDYDDTGMPPTKKPFNFVELSPEELRRGQRLYYCLAKVKELRLRNVTGYFITADDLIFHVWTEIDLSTTFHPLGIKNVNKGRKWYHTNGGYRALRYTEVLFEEKYKHKQCVQQLLRKYETRVSPPFLKKDAMNYIVEDSGYSTSDLFYVPVSEIDYFSDLMEIFFEAGVFVGIAVNRFLASVPFNMSHRKAVQFLWHHDRVDWTKWYHRDLVLLHPIKPSTLVDVRNRHRFCSTVVRTFKEVLLQ